MKDSDLLKEISQTLKKIESHQERQSQGLEKLNSTLIRLFSKTTSDPEPPAQTEPEPEPKLEPRTFGWSMANLMQVEGKLRDGDRKIEQDDSTWIWTGDIWERVELPSA